MKQKTILFVMLLSLLHCSVGFANQAPAQDLSWYNWFKSTFGFDVKN